jgi:pimeloyl-ACP methyl ester carboxylesterase
LIETDPEVFAVVYRLSDERWYSRPPQTHKPAILYISHLSSDAELREEPLLEELLTDYPNTPFYTCDVRGTGESRPNTGRYNSYLEPYGNDYFYSILSVMLDRPYIGQKTYDILRTIDWLESLGHREIHLVGKGLGSLPAAFAAVLSDNVTRVTLKNAPTSYTDIASAEIYDWPLSAFVPDVLKYFDLPDCYRILRQKELVQIDTWGPTY